LAELQTSDLDVEAMTSLYQRAQAYAERCEALLNQVEQEVMQWDPQLPDQPPRSLQP
jgi:exodeoxyribonuclease VII small subunit